ncbi:MAG: hypothetical protein ACRELF_24655, partial [Gemmataceae bacterium]
DMPTEFRAKYDSTVARLTTVSPLADEGAFRATIERMSEEEACEIANQILTLAYMAREVSEELALPLHNR